MAFTVNLYKLDKRVNSTKQPTGSGTTVSNVVLKGPCSVYNPTFIFDNIADDFNYLKWGSRYYFVTDCIRSVGNQQFVQYNCVLDELATLKSNILSTTAFVAYSTSATPNGYCLDPRIPTDKSVYFSGGTSLSVTAFDSTGTYIVGCVGTNGIRYYALTAAQLSTLAGSITAATGTDIDNTFVNKFGSLIDCITSVYWIPIATSSVPGTTDTVYLGSYSTGITATVAPTLGWLFIHDASLTVNYVNSVYRRMSNERISVYIPGYGAISLEPSAIGYESTINVNGTIDVQGNIVYRLTVYHNSSIIYTSVFPCSVGVEIPFGKTISTPQAAGAEFIGNISDEIKTIADNFEQKHPKLASAVNTITSTIDGGTLESGSKFMSEIARLGANAVTVGGLTGAAGARMLCEYPYFCVINSSFGYCETQANMDTLYGQPVNKVLSLSTLTGYVQCVNASVSGNYPQNILNSVSAQLNSGIYLE